MLAYYSGWNYLLELYFWLILAALLLVSITIYFGRPKATNQNQNMDMELLEGNIDSLDAPKAVGQYAPNLPGYTRATKVGTMGFNTER